MEIQQVMGNSVIMAKGLMPKCSKARGRAEVRTTSARPSRKRNNRLGQDPPKVPIDGWGFCRNNRFSSTQFRRRHRTLKESLAPVQVKYQAGEGLISSLDAAYGLTRASACPTSVSDVLWCCWRWLC